MLGYLIALQPAYFCRYFGFLGSPLAVRLETRHEDDRSDILLETTAGRGVIEAKTNATDPLRQSLKYPAKWRVLLTQHMASARQKSKRGVRYIRWLELAKTLKDLAKSKDDRVRFVSGDLIGYLEEHAMIKKTEAVEIYAREINNEETLAVFLKAHIYGCPYQKGSRLAEALYFAPHFGQRIARKHPGVQVGVSYIARIECVEVIETWKDFIQVNKEVRGKHWLNSHMELLQPLKTSWGWGVEKRNVIFLGTPRLVFNPPVLKENLQKGSGWLSKQYFSFDTLFSAWGC